MILRWLTLWIFHCLCTEQEAETEKWSSFWETQDKDSKLVGFIRITAFIFVSSLLLCLSFSVCLSVSVSVSLSVCFFLCVSLFSLSLHITAFFFVVSFFLFLSLFQSLFLTLFSLSLCIRASCWPLRTDASSRGTTLCINHVPARASNQKAFWVKQHLLSSRWTNLGKIRKIRQIYFLARNKPQIKPSKKRKKKKKCTNLPTLGLGPVHAGRGGARKCCTQKIEHIVANWSVHTALETIASNIKGFASKFAWKSAYASCVKGALEIQPVESVVHKENRKPGWSDLDNWGVS